MNRCFDDVYHGVCFCPCERAAQQGTAKGRIEYRIVSHFGNVDAGRDFLHSPVNKELLVFVDALVGPILEMLVRPSGFIPQSGQRSPADIAVQFGLNELRNHKPPQREHITDYAKITLTADYAWTGVLWCEDRLQRQFRLPLRRQRGDQS